MDRLNAIILSGIIALSVYLFFVWFLRGKGSKYTKAQNYVRYSKLPSKFLRPNWICSERTIIGWIGLYFYFYSNLYWLGILLFTISAVLDGVDGLVARKCGLITDFGEEYDPLCDKLTYLPPMVIFAYQGLLDVTIIFVFVGIEFLGQFAIRFYLKKYNFSIAANNFGKIKAVLCFSLIIYCAILQDGLSIPNFTEQITYLCIFLGIASAVFKIIPNRFYADILSGFNFICGSIGIGFVLSGYYTYAVIAVIFGQLFDLFDGRMAIKHGGTKLGPWLDNLADFVSFGICPAIMIIKQGEWNIFVFFIGCFYLLAVTYRLRRFIKKDKNDKTLPFGVFRGLPSPAGAIIIFGVCLSFQNIIIVWLCVLITFFLMVSDKLRFSHFGRVIVKQIPKPIVVLVGTCIFIALAYLIKIKDTALLGVALILIFLLYIGLGLLIKPKKKEAMDI